MIQKKFQEFTSTAKLVLPKDDQSLKLDIRFD